MRRMTVAFLKCVFIYFFSELLFLLPLVVTKRCYLSSAWSLKCPNFWRVVMERKDDILNNVLCLERKIEKKNRIDVRVDWRVEGLLSLPSKRTWKSLCIIMQKYRNTKKQQPKNCILCSEFKNQFCSHYILHNICTICCIILWSSVVCYMDMFIYNF